MYVSCPSCFAQVEFSESVPLRLRCACSYPWTEEDTARATAQPSHNAIVVHNGPVVRNGLVNDGGIVYHVAPAPIIERYRDQRSWSYIVRAVDHLVATLTDLEDQIAQHAHGVYDWETDRFQDVGDLSDLSDQAVAAFVTQFRNLPSDRQVVLQPYLTWAISVVRHCADTMEPRLAAARAADAPNAQARRIHAWRERIDARGAELAEERREAREARSARWGLLGAAVAAYSFTRHRR